MAVFDRPKTVALKWGRDGQVTEWNAVFAGVALDLAVGIEVCRPFNPEQKGSIENLGLPPRQPSTATLDR